MPRKGTRTVIICRECGWQSSRMNEEELKNLGVPWYCEVCGKNVYSYITYEPHEEVKMNEALKIELDAYNFRIKNRSYY